MGFSSNKNKPPAVHDRDMGKDSGRFNFYSISSLHGDHMRSGHRGLAALAAGRRCCRRRRRRRHRRRHHSHIPRASLGTCRVESLRNSLQIHHHNRWCNLGRSMAWRPLR